jgi:glyoxylase-like metal-dependent hydrolase (beta-lactamase superfamily II)
MSAVPDATWFYWREARPGLWLIAEPAHVCTWLVVGSERACLFDTGTGLAPIRPVVEAITALPVVVVNSHYHFDHIGGNAEFERVAIHRAGGELLGDAPRRRSLGRYLDVIGDWEADVAAFRELDANLFALLTVELDPRPFPAGLARRVATAAARQPEVALLDDGDAIELGDRTLRAIHTPGHSPDGLSLLDERDGLLLCGDAFNLGLVYCHFTDSDLGALRATAARLAGLSDTINLIAAHHHPRVIAEPNLLVAYDDAVRALGDVPTTPTVDVFGQPCLLASFDHVGITLPDPAQPGATVG